MKGELRLCWWDIATVTLEWHSHTVDFHVFWWLKYLSGTNNVLAYIQYLSIMHSFLSFAFLFFFSEWNLKKDSDLELRFTVKSYDSDSGTESWVCSLYTSLLCHLGSHHVCQGTVKVDQEGFVAIIDKLQRSKQFECLATDISDVFSAEICSSLLYF